MKTHAILLLSLCALAPLPLSARCQQPMPIPNEEYTRHVFVDSLNSPMPYRMLSPSHIEKGVKYPLVLFLHGSGERGDDNESQLAYGASTFSNPANVDKFPAFVVFPQCREKFWTGKIDTRSFQPGAPIPDESRSEAIVMSLLDSLIADYPIDTDRVYIIGISMGGIAAYDLVCRYPDRFTAAVPICGAVNPDRLFDAKDVSFMIFHGETDEEVPSFCSREAYRSLSAAGSNVDYVEFAGVGHECWDFAFNYPTLLPWLFSQTKSAADTPAEQLTCSTE